MGEVIYACFPQHRPRPVEVALQHLAVDIFSRLHAPEPVVTYGFDDSGPSEMPPPEAS